jgi:uncharacterized membrane protein
VNDIALARALHVLAIAHWIGGVAFVTLVVLPLAIRDNTPGLFEAVERRFGAQVRISILVAGASGLWMTWRMDLWGRFLDADLWWMGAMAALWAVFMLMLFVAEPLLHDVVAALVRSAPRRTLVRMMTLHVILLLIASAIILGAVSGSHGGVF